MKKISAILISAAIIAAITITSYAIDEPTYSEDSTTLETGKSGASEGGESYCKNSAHNENTNSEGIFETVISNISSILSILTFLISLLLTLLYKKGQIPDLDGTLGSIDDSVKAIGQRAEEGILGAEKAVREIDVKIEEMGTVIEGFSGTIKRINEKILELEEKKESGEISAIMIRSQVEELCEIFTSCEISEQKKQSLEEKLTELKSHFEKITDK